MGRKSKTKASLGKAPPGSPKDSPVSPPQYADVVPASPTYGSGQPLLHVRRNAYFEADRKCRDVLCGVLFGAFWVGMATISIFAYQNGNVGALVYPMDHSGKLCNASAPVAFYPHPTLDIKSPYYYGICVAECPTKGQVVSGIAVEYDTVNVFHRCVPSNLTAVSDDVADDYAGILGRAATNFKLLSRFIEDIRKTWRPIVGVSCGIGFLGSVLWMALMHRFPGTVVWGSLFVSVATLVLATGVAAVQANFIQSEVISTAIAASFELQLENYYETGFKYITVVLLTITALLILVLAFMFSRVRLSVGVIHEACRGIGHLPSLYVFPLFQMGKLVALFVYFVASSLYIASCGNISLADLESVVSTGQAQGNVNTKVVEAAVPTLTIEYGNGTTQGSNWMKACFAYNVFGIFWTQQLIEAVTICTIAGAIARFYWCDSSDQLGFAVMKSYGHSFRYHFGSLAFGAAVVAVVQFFRVVLEYVDHQTKHAQNSVVKVVLCCCRACLWCLHKFVKFLSRNGYIVIAMKGSSFCVAIVDAFELVSANLLRIGTLSIVSTFVMFMGKMLIAAVCTLLVFWDITDYEVDLHLSSPFPTLVITAVLAYSIASLFFSVFEIAIDTVLLSICEDEKLNRTTAKYYASKEIRAYLDNSAHHAFDHHKQIESAKRTDVRV
ncbi:hypothetical protein H310_12745 [Aphanomyces invadans]|uniref:Choline transporter-like protein n=1 Tax=Aphanomyces invadans TaxID=157072 RepID=A0A024TGJ7_9STRA|nr:hypothetical protein H310_12745 [Aphanomyces invadans]ETV93134.1 hypothetical protein H310_12745 [Aphanomyces invadans]|eukprot:XP_008878156.1 hypothetical protein H310_12745 [Aphanomyces invadans]